MLEGIEQETATASHPSPPPLRPRLRDKQALEEQEQQLRVAEQRLGASREALDRLVKVLSAVRAGAEHLVDKLHHISLVDIIFRFSNFFPQTPFLLVTPRLPLSPLQSEESAAEAPPDSDEFVPVLLRLCETKLRRLHDELQGNDVAATLKEMEEEEVCGVHATYNSGGRGHKVRGSVSFSSSATVSRIKDSDIH